MNEKTYESCVNCSNIHICSGPDYIDGNCDPGFKAKDQNKDSKNKPNDKDSK